MNLSLNVLKRHINIEQTPIELRHLLDDIGIEVKRMEEVEDDIVYGLELLANRGDHHCYMGIAREISGRTGHKICGPLTPILTIGDGYPVVNETDLCLRYTATKMKRTGDAQGLSSIDLKPLGAAGIHSLTAPVDATNLSNIEIGQPTHVFDATKVIGPIRIRLSQEGEQAWLLFEESARKIPAGTIVIADDEKILAIAGVIGCEDSKTTEDTTEIIIESACFDPVQVRKTGRALGQHTDALARFERGADPELAIVGAGRVAHLLETVGWELVGESTQVGAWDNTPRCIAIDVNDLNRFLGTSLSGEEVSARLERYGFSLDSAGEMGFNVTVPTHRIWDVHTVFDIYEEIAKSVGYNAIPTTLPKIDKGALPSRLEQHRDLVENLFIGAGFLEVITDGFYGRTDFDKLGLPSDHPLQHHVETQNSLDKGYSLLKNNCLLQAVDCVRKNMHRNYTNIKVYEWTRTFHLNSDAANGVCDEELKLWAVVSGAERAPTWQGKAPVASPLYLKGLVSELSNQLGLDLVVKVEKDTHVLAPLLHPHRQASVWLNNECVGVLGEIHPRICKDFKIKRARPCYIELSQTILSKTPRAISYVLPDIHQPLVRTVAFSLPGQVEAASVQSALASVGSHVNVSIVDLFAFEDESGAQRAITFEMVFANPDGSLSADACNQQLQNAMDAVLSRFGEQGVKHR